MNSLPPVAHLLAPDGVYRVRTNFEYLGPVDNHLQAAANSQITVIPDLASIGDRPVGLAVSKVNRRMWVNLPSLKLDTYWVIGESGKLIPTFKGDAGTSIKCLTWTPPPKVKLFFVAVFNTAHPQQTKDTCYLVATFEGSQGFHRPPLPNIFEDCRLCLGGEGGKALTTGPLLDQFNSLIEVFYAGTWNGDLLTQTPNYAEVANWLFSYTVEDNPVQVPPPTATARWKPSWLKVSSGNFEDLPLV